MTLIGPDRPLHHPFVTISVCSLFGPVIESFGKEPLC